MDQRAERLRYEIETSFAENRGPAYMDEWHPKYPQRPDRYKNKNRREARRMKGYNA